ncbi:InlB B-repeat-containing protein [Lacrimispora sp.]|uniref:InlB B-repeat-containing protein n=1 Tax=Lacrimispora sp. TaxID=2719234 RepID=UPI0039921D78
MEKKRKIIPAFLILVFFSFNTYFSVYATENVSNHSELSLATSSEAVNKNLVQESLHTFTVVFHPDDGVTSYEDFFKIKVSEGSLISTKPDTPKRDGYIFKGWYGYLDENYKPVLWNFNTDIIEENTTLWACWEKACLVAFNPDDGVTAYNDFYKVMVPAGSLVTAKPDTPKREGYIFKGWYSYLDENNNPVLWDFNTDIIEENTTLWACWEKACLVAFDPDDGVTAYNDFYKVMVPAGSLVTAKPDTPKREGYIFKGWYSYLDSTGKPVFWNFNTDTVVENTTLWAFWEEACLATFDPNDGITGYEDFFKTTVPVGGFITSKPNTPKRKGYRFLGWYSYLDENNNPVFWNFDTDTVSHNITLWAAWNEDKETESNGNNNENGNGNENGNVSGNDNGNENGNVNGNVNGNDNGNVTPNGNENETPQKGSSGSSSSSSKKKGGPTPTKPQTSEEDSIDLEEQYVSISENTPVPEANMISSNKLDSMPKTGGLDILRYGTSAFLSLLLLPVLLFRRNNEQ